MQGAKRITLWCGILTAVVGACMILVSDKVAGLLWLGIGIQLGGMALIWMGSRKPKPVDPTVPPKPLPAWFPYALFAILFLQFGFLMWWTKAGK
jgi:hypothetical protein